MSKKSKIEPVHEQEAATLKALFNERASLSQAAFGDEYEIGTQGMVWQYLNARASLNLSVALKFARGLACEVADFSPRLAAELVALEQGPSPSPEALAIARQFDALSVDRREAVRTFIDYQTYQAGRDRVFGASGEEDRRQVTALHVPRERRGKPNSNQ